MDNAHQWAVGVGVAAYALLGWQSIRLMRSKNYLMFFIWPAFIYLIGPTATLLYVDNTGLNSYIDESRIAAQTLLMAWYLFLLIVADKFVGMSAALRRALNGATVRRLSSSPLFPMIYVTAALTAAALQIHSLVNFGTILSGSYNLLDLDEIPYWGFLAGLYEIVFLCFILLLLGERPRRKLWRLYIGVYLLTTVLRVLGGTRLILIKELAFMIILFYMRGAIKPRRLLIIGSFVIAVGSGIGLLRLGAVDEQTGFLGPLYGLVMESGLNALTLGIADSVNQMGIVARDASTLGSVAFFALSVVPSFLRFGINDADLAALSPYAISASQFDRSAPVGGMSGFATIEYLTDYPHLLLFILVFAFFVWFRMMRNGGFRQILGLLIMINAVHFWRDPTEIAFKLVVQGLVICGTLAAVRRRRVGFHAMPFAARSQDSDRPSTLPLPAD